MMQAPHHHQSLSCHHIPRVDGWCDFSYIRSGMSKSGSFTSQKQQHSTNTTTQQQHNHDMPKGKPPTETLANSHRPFKHGSKRLIQSDLRRSDRERQNSQSHTDMNCLLLLLLTLWAGLKGYVFGSCTGTTSWDMSCQGWVAYCEEYWYGGYASYLQWANVGYDGLIRELKCVAVG